MTASPAPRTCSSPRPARRSRCGSCPGRTRRRSWTRSSPTSSRTRPGAPRSRSSAPRRRRRSGARPTGRATPPRAPALERGVRQAGGRGRLGGSIPLLRTLQQAAPGRRVHPLGSRGRRPRADPRLRRERRPRGDREHGRRAGAAPAAVRRRRDRLTHANHLLPPRHPTHPPKGNTMTDTTPQDTPDVVAAALTDGATTLFVADFADTSTAWEAYEALKSVEDGRHVAIDGVIVVKRETDGDLVVQKATDHSTKRGLTWGLVGRSHTRPVVPALAPRQRRCPGRWRRGTGQGPSTPPPHRAAPISSRTPSRRATPASSPSSPTRPSSRSAERWSGRMPSSSRRSTTSSPRTSRPSPRRPRRNDRTGGPAAHPSPGEARSTVAGPATTTGNFASQVKPLAVAIEGASSWFSRDAAGRVGTPHLRRRRPASPPRKRR